MELLTRLLVAATLGACYAPDFVDCAVPCTSDDDCADSQRCSAGVCARAEVTCTTDPTAPADAAVIPTDGPEPDASPGQTELRIKIHDLGEVRVPGHGVCAMMQCTYRVPEGIPIVLEAVPHADRRFERWDERCMGQPTAVCTITPGPGPETKVTARFRPDDDDDDDAL